MQKRQIFNNLTSLFNQNVDIDDIENDHEDDIVDDASQGENLPTIFWWTNKVYRNEGIGFGGNKRKGRIGIFSKRAWCLQETYQCKKKNATGFLTLRISGNMVVNDMIHV